MRIDEIERELKETERLLAEANEHFAARKFKEAHPLFEKALTMLSASFGAEDSRTLTCMSSLGDCCYELRRFDDAARHYHKVLAVRERRGELRDHEYPSSLFKLAKAYAQVPRPKEAFKYFTRAAQSAREMCLAGDPLLGNILEAHAALLQRMGNSTEADALRDEARINRQKFGSSSQVVDRFMQPLSGLQFQTIPPGQSYKPFLEFSNQEATEPVQVKRKLPLMFISKTFSAAIIVLSILGVIAFAFTTFAPHKPKVEYITEPEPNAAIQEPQPQAVKTIHRTPAAQSIQTHKTPHIAKTKPPVARTASPAKAAPAPAKKAAPVNQWNQLKNLREYN